MEEIKKSLLQNDANFGRKDELWEGVLYASLTVNFCVLWSQIIPIIFKYILPMRCVVSSQDRRTVISKLSTDSVFHLGLPLVGFILVIRTDILTDPFFTFGTPFLVVFSIQIGRLIFVILRNSLSEVKIDRSNATMIHHSLAIFIYTVIICYRQSAISGVIGLILEGHMLLHECGNFLKPDGQKIASRSYMVILILDACGAVMFRALIPIVLICISSLRSDVLKSLFAMDYIPLASFFLSAVFYLAISCWKIFDEIQRVIASCSKSSNTFKVSPLVKVVIMNSFNNPTPEKSTEAMAFENNFMKNISSDPRNEDTVSEKCGLYKAGLEPLGSIPKCCLVDRNGRHSSSCSTLLEFEEVPL